MLNFNHKKSEEGIVIKKQIHLAAKLFTRAMEVLVFDPALRELPGEKLTRVQFNALRFVYCHDRPSGMELAQGLRISNAAATKLIDRLVKKKLLKRTEHPEDRRLLKLSLTGEGTKLIMELLEQERIIFDGILAKMHPADVESLYRGLVAFMTSGLERKELVDDICLYCGKEHIVDCPGDIVYKKLTGRHKDKV